MKLATLALGILSMGFFLASLSGCQTTSPGTSNTLGEVTTEINGAPDKVTDAAKKAADDMKLMNVVASGTTVDGKVTAKEADGTDVWISVAQSGDKVSKVTIRVGATGDSSVSQQLIDGIKKHMSFF